MLAVIAQIIVLLLAILVLTTLAARAFSARLVQFAGAPAVPSVLTSRLGFRAGILSYCLLLILFYVCSTYYWGPLKVALWPIVDDIDFLKPYSALLNPGASTGEAVIPWIVAIVAAIIFTWDSKYNPFTIVLEGIFDCLQIPDKAIGVYQTLRKTIFGQIDETLANRISTDSDISQCKAEYFKQDRRNLEYRWAHVCYLRYALLLHLRQSGRYDRFFSEQTLQWETIDSEYQKQASTIGLWITGSRDYRDAAEILDEIGKLKEQHYRLLACLAVGTSRNDKEIWERVRDISKTEVKKIPNNLGRYVVFFIASIFLSILIGRELSVALYLIAHAPTPEIKQFDVDALKYWVLVSIIVYSGPIVLVFLGRIALSRYFPFGRRRFWLLYLAAFVIGYLLTMILLPELSSKGVAFHPMTSEYWQAIYQRWLIWPIMPGFVTALVAFRLDSRASCQDDRRRGNVDRALAGMCCGGVGILVAILGCVGGSVPVPTSWVIVFTTATVGAVIGWLSRFETE